MSIYVEGSGSRTLVFLSGGGTCSPILDFKSLYSLLSDDQRLALNKAGIEGPYVLCPHSMSGIETLYWAQKYPDEIEAIVGLDMAVPEYYENMRISIPLMKLGQYAADLGITRVIPGLAESDAIKYGTLTEYERISEEIKNFLGDQTYLPMEYTGRLLGVGDTCLATKERIRMIVWKLSCYICSTIRL